MQNYSFRDYHLLQLLKDYFSAGVPIDVAVCRYFRGNKALGSKDRQAIAEAAYGLIRWHGLLEALAPDSDWLEKVNVYNNAPWLHTDGLAAHTAVSFPQELYTLICAAYGEEEGHRLCLVSNTPAPTCVRVNTLKTNREALLDKWQHVYQVVPTQHSTEGIIFKQRIHFLSMPEFRDGLFEVQDEGSQLVSSLVEATPGQLVLDYCAGAGGKSLAIAPRLKLKGQLLLHDIRIQALQEARLRLRRAGVQNIQILSSDSPQWSKWKKKMDWILVDAPCSGTGTLRRNPDMKWRFSLAELQRLQRQQRSIFERALSYLKPGGHIVYVTCSLLPAENQEQIAHFQATYGLTLIDTPLQTLPTLDGMDGFFGAVLKHRP